VKVKLPVEAKDNRSTRSKRRSFRGEERMRLFRCSGEVNNRDVCMYRGCATRVRTHVDVWTRRRHTRKTAVAARGTGCTERFRGSSASLNEATAIPVALLNLIVNRRARLTCAGRAERNCRNRFFANDVDFRPATAQILLEM